MSVLKSLLACAALIGMCAPALAQLSPEEAKLLAKFRAATPAQRQVALRELDAKPKRSAIRGAVAAPVVTGTTADDPSPPPVITIFNKNTPAVRDYLEARAKEAARSGPSATPRELSACPGLVLLLRQDWKDVGLLGCPDTTEKAAGAELSYTGDRVAKNNIFVAHGTAAAYYHSMTDAPGLYDQSFGAYLTVNRTLNSSPAQVKGDSDKIVLGGMGELGFQTATGANFFRFRSGVVEDRLKSTSSANFTAEWIPVYDDGTIHIHRPFPFFGAILRFDPELLVQYNAVTGNGQVLDFNGRKEALRVGPQLTMKVFPGLDANSFFARMTADVTYHWAYETYAARPISWFQSSVTYNLDDAGQFGITASYKKGRDEDTGTLTDIYKLALTGKI